EIGRIGIVARKVLKAFDIEQDVVFAELDFDVLCRLAARTKVTFTDLPRTQPVRRDLALLIDKNTAFADIDRTVRKAAGKMLRSLTLFDVYEGERLPEGKKSYAIALTLQDDEKTLTDKQIDAVMHKVTEALAKSIGAELR
ncbi:MAG: phenylalanine--tRNA ligase subunit beta, partial [Muribaculaceae bacterium]|nr:phenylalanine--tRNA ligase subunit beta [Muribaculaceae bacterium]